ncbi:hypothetical protein [Burkholderia sp. Ac-20365]|uniref:hypothetical protein n=1 Tax=Burkholderia sp. Ac-20365 TaxID=2703897 RepID=UPI00197BCF53|nr:hypothetical protein [Burkholderia sp. Ac-20365]MBN3763663.1 hypothetical protein [Burkholderia sp. Ac-20365]
MTRTSSALLAAFAALTLSGGAYAQSNNTLATPSTVSPVAPKATSDYGTPGGSNSDSGMSSHSQNSGAQSASGNSTPAPGAYGANNTLATPSTASPVK